MKRLFLYCACMGLWLSLTAISSGQQAVRQADYRPDRDAAKNQLAAAVDQLGTGVETASYSSSEISMGDYYNAPYSDPGCDAGCADECGYGPSLLSHGLLPRCSNGTRYFIGGEYLHVRANPSEAVSYLERDINNFTDTFNQFDFDYEGSFRFYGGCRNCCGEELRFTWTRFDTGSSFSSPTVPDGSAGSIQIVSPLEVVATIDGSYTVGTANVELNSFDLGWSKTIPLGSPLGCDSGCCDPCGDGCSDPCGNWCPAWDLTFTGALRGADLSANRNFASVGPDGEFNTVGSSEMDFEGLGGRVGMLGRRYFGRQGVCSLYVKGDISLLVGDYSTTQYREDVSQTFPGPVTEQTIGCRHVIPVTEIEAGGTVFVTSNTSVTGGYFMSTWHDLGYRDEYDYGLQISYDDANIMAFDGFFLRVETSF
jgi:hypothetical protein